jgi:putative acetyltransferase
MKIRSGDLADRDVLLDIWLRSVRATHTFLTETDIQSILPMVRDEALVELELWVLCVGECNAIGFMGLSGSNVEAQGTISRRRGDIIIAWLSSAHRAV